MSDVNRKIPEKRGKSTADYADGADIRRDQCFARWEFVRNRRLCIPLICQIREISGSNLSHDQRVPYSDNPKQPFTA
jgi:hypothetical protein